MLEYKDGEGFCFVSDDITLAMKVPIKENAVWELFDEMWESEERGERCWTLYRKAASMLVALLDLGFGSCVNI